MIKAAIKGILCGIALGVFFKWDAPPTGAWPHGGSATQGTTYYISPTGNDSNNGLSPGAAWLSPNHSVNCGDAIIAAAGTYSSANFAVGKWGTVSNCPSPQGIYFATVQCAGPFVASCSITDTTGNVMVVNKSNWAVIGWLGSSTNGSCFSATPALTATTIHHIAFVNSVANGCMQNGFNSFTNFGGSPQFGVDYFAVVGVIAFNAAQGTLNCYSGVSVYEPANSDTVAGTHIYIAGVFAFKNIDNVTCGGSVNSDGEGVIFDDWSHSQQAGSAYTGQGVIEQSLVIGNGSNGVQIFHNTAATVIVTGVTSYGNMQNSTKTGTYLGELLLNGNTASTSITNSIWQATVASVAGGTVYGTFVGLGNGANSVTGNYIFGVGGNNTQSDSSPGFSYGSNTLATPNFVNPVVPTSVPDSACATSSDVVICMAATIANFTAQAGGAAGKGYQPPGACAPNANYPVWLKGIVPNGIVTKPCGY